MKKQMQKTMQCALGQIILIYVDRPNALKDKNKNQTLNRENANSVSKAQGIPAFPYRNREVSALVCVLGLR